MATQPTDESGIMSTFNDDLVADLADPEFARTFVAQVQDEVNRTAAALEATCQREEREREALQEIGDNPGQYGGASAVARWGLGDDDVTWRRKPDVTDIEEGSEFDGPVCI